MKSVTQTKGLGDMRTTISTHARSSPPQTGSTYLQIYLLDKERMRLQTEMAMLNKRGNRIHIRLEEIAEVSSKLLSAAQREGLAGTAEIKEGGGEPTGGIQGQHPPISPSKPHASNRPGQWRQGVQSAPEWKRITVDY